MSLFELRLLIILRAWRFEVVEILGFTFNADYFQLAVEI